MKFHGIQLNEGSAVTNMTLAAGTAFPDNPNEGELFFRTDANTSVKGMYLYVSGAWTRIIISSDPVTPGTGAVGGGGESSAGSLLKLMFSVITFFAIMLVKVAGKVIKFYAKLYFINIFYNIFFVNNVGYIFSFFGFDPIFSPIEISPNPFVLFDYALNNVGVLINIFLAFSPLVRVFFGFFMNSTLQFLITVPNIFVVILSFLDGHAVSALYREVGVFDSFWTITPFYSSICFVILSLFLYGIINNHENLRGNIYK
jgi:hypothetical protein